MSKHNRDVPETLAPPENANNTALLEQHNNMKEQRAMTHQKGDAQHASGAGKGRRGSGEHRKGTGSAYKVHLPFFKIYFILFY